MLALADIIITVTSIELNAKQFPTLKIKQLAGFVIDPIQAYVCKDRAVSAIAIPLPIYPPTVHDAVLLPPAPLTYNPTAIVAVPLSIPPPSVQIVIVLSTDPPKLNTQDCILPAYPNLKFGAQTVQAKQATPSADIRTLSEPAVTNTIGKLSRVLK